MPASRIAALAVLFYAGTFAGNARGQSLFDQLQAGARDGLDRVLSPSADGQKAYLGIRGDDDPRGVAVLSVRTGGSADAAGILPGDVITAVQGRPTRNMDALAGLLQTSKPGDEISVDLLRGGRRITARVTLGSFANPAPPGPARAPAPPAAPLAEPPPSAAAGETFPLPAPRNRPPSLADTPPPPLPGDQLDDSATAPGTADFLAPSRPQPGAAAGQPQPPRRSGPLLQRVGPLLDRVAPLIDEVVAPDAPPPAYPDAGGELQALRRQVTTLQSEIDALKRRLAELESRLEDRP